MEADGAVINGQYRVMKRLGGGSFGDIYMGVSPSGEKVAIKLEKQGTRCPKLRHEHKVYRELQNCVGFGSIHYFGTHNAHSVMVMTLHDASLEDLFTKCDRRFSLKTVLQIGDHILERMEIMHSQHLIHRDVKPANFVLGLGKNPSIYCIDFGLSTRYRHPRTMQHIPYRENRSLTGTPRYASINNHLGIEQSRRDDLESIGYILIYFLRGSLPWQGIKERNAKKKYKKILEKKQSTSIHQLCQGLPHQFATYLNFCRNLDFEADPNIPYLRGLFRELYRDRRYDTAGSNWSWDWSALKGENRIRDGQQLADDSQTAPTAKVQDGKTTIQPQQQHGGGSIIERADGHQRETAKTKAKALPQTTPQAQSSCLVTNLQKKSSQTSIQGSKTANHHTRETQAQLQGRKLSGSCTRPEPKKISSYHDLFNHSQMISTVHKKNNDSMFTNSDSKGMGAYGAATPNLTRSVVGSGGSPPCRNGGSPSCRNGGWNMWNTIRPSTSGGFWNSQKRAWTARANPFSSKSKATNVMASESQRRHSSAVGTNGSSLAAATNNNTSKQKEYARQQRRDGKQAGIERSNNNEITLGHI